MTDQVTEREPEPDELEPDPTGWDASEMNDAIDHDNEEDDPTEVAVREDE